MPIAKISKKKTAPLTKDKARYTNKGRITSARVLHVAEELSWNYGKDVVVYDVRKKTPYVSYYIVASANNDRRLQALVATADEALYDNFFDLGHKEGRNDSTWILLDAKTVVVQLFTEEMRDHVDFDALYEDCPHKVVVADKEPKYRKRKKPASQQG